MNLYPFPAIVGQEKLKKALLLCAVNPGIGGVLIKGEKGTAKTTAVRGLADMMPPALYESGLRPAPFVDLPLGASEDRVLGSLDIEVMLSEKKKTLLPGLLAEAHQGILYIDEVNLLADHLVDVLLDVSASGVNTVQREGLSVSHPSRFVLIGTMNPEEGNLRPQFLDRFGLMVEVETHGEVGDRTEVVKRRIAFERDPGQFVEAWQKQGNALRQQIGEARQLLPHVQLSDGLLSMIGQLCIEWAVGSLRADIVMYKTAATIAAWNGRNAVTASDIREAAALVLPHRRGKKPLQGEPKRDEDGEKEERKMERKSGEDNQECGEGECGDSSVTEVAEIGFGMNVQNIGSKEAASLAEPVAGRSVKVRNVGNGAQVRVEKDLNGGDLALNETLIHALSRETAHFEIQRADLHRKVRNGKAGHLILFVVDASGSMAAGKRMEAVKGSVVTLLQNAYQKRDMVAVIAFRGVEATVLLEPTRSTDLAEQALAALPTGGRTPLPQALQLAETLIRRTASAGQLQPFVVVLTDGKANVPLDGAGDAWAQSLLWAGQLRHLDARAMVLDTESGYVRQGRARELAEALGAEYMVMGGLSAEDVTETISTRINHYNV